MQRMSLRARIGAAVTGLTVAAVIGTTLAPSANAAGPVAGAAIASSSVSTVYAALTNQPAGEWTTNALPNIAPGDTIDIQIDDGDFGVPSASNNCSPGDAVGFASIPTVTNLTPGNAAAFTAALHQGVPPETGGPCDLANVNDVVRLTATAVGGSGAVLRISNIRLDVGNAVALGPIRYRVNSTGDFTTAHSVASVSDVRVAAVTPLTLVAPNTQDQAVSNVAFQEQRPGALFANDVCVRITAPAGTTFDGDPAPVLATSGGNGVPTEPSATGTDAKFKVAAASGTATLIQLSGLRVNTGTAVGPIDAQPLESCANPATALGPTVRLGFVGTVARIPGANRYATAQQIAVPLGCNSDTSVVIARGDNFPDALSASFLAGRNDAPILLTATSSLPPETIAALKQIGARSVTIIGGTEAVSAGVAAALDGLPVYDCNTQQPLPNDQTLTVARVFGADRYATARNVALTAGLGSVGTTDSGLDGVSCAGNLKKTAIVASGENFPDALSAGPLAYAGLLAAGGACGTGSLPLLLTHPAGIPQITVDAILEHGIEQVIVMGGTVAVSAAVEKAIDDLNGGAVNVIRIAGPDRQGTAAELARRVLGPDNLGSFGIPLAAGGGAFFVSRPDTFPDALAAAPLAGTTASPLFLAASTSSLGTTTTNAVATYPSSALFSEAVLLGGTDALSPQVATDAGTALASQPSS